MDRIIILSRDAAAQTEIDRLLQGSTFLFAKEHALVEVLGQAFDELSFVVRQFDLALTRIQESGLPSLDHYLPEINAIDVSTSNTFFVELHSSELSTFFKSFLILGKSVLDKLVPFYSYRYGGDLKQFSDKGKRLLNVIGCSPHVARKAEMDALIRTAKNEWINSLVDLRDEYAHYSLLPEFRSFWIRSDRIKSGRIDGIGDFNRPAIRIGDNEHDASTYLNTIHEHLLLFVRQFLSLCDFNDSRSPKAYLHCENCGNEFAQWKGRNKTEKGQLVLKESRLHLRMKNARLNYAVIVCPRCNEQTDTNVAFWREHGFNVEGEKGLELASRPVG